MSSEKPVEESKKRSVEESMERSVEEEEVVSKRARVEEEVEAEGEVEAKGEANAEGDAKGEESKDTEGETNAEGQTNAEGETTSEAQKEPEDKVQGEEATVKDAASAPKFVFGAKTSFGSGFASAKKTDIFADKSEAPKFVFGSTTSFGAGFGAAKKASGDEEKPAFGSSFGFGAGFNAVKKNQDIFDSKDSTPEVAAATFTPVVQLTKQEIKSGEEDEECVFSVNAKLYQLNLSDIKAGWKERGVGVVRVNRAKTGHTSRVLMRSRGLLNVILNVPLVKGIELNKGFPGSLQSEKFIRITAVSEGKPVQYALKVGKSEVCDELHSSIKDLL